MITHERLKYLLDYDQKSGIFRWRIWFGRAPGSRAGTVVIPHGYRRVRIDGRYYPEHRLAWFYVNRRWPTLIDHRNGDRADNRLTNLREASRQQNSSNIRKTKPNKWGYRGVKKRHGRPGFMAVIRHERKRYWLGPFPTPEEAHAAYAEADQRFRGDFAATLKVERTQPIIKPAPFPMPMRGPLTQARLREVLSYNPDSGEWRWLINGDLRKQWNRAGTVAGKADAEGYHRVFFDGGNFKLHQLVWLYLYGRFAERPIDHINGNRADNHLCNLREVSAAENMMNRGQYARCNGLPKGVHRSGTRYRATICPNGQHIHLGMFDTPEEAGQAYQAATREHFGKFARAS